MINWLFGIASRLLWVLSVIIFSVCFATCPFWGIPLWVLTGIGIFDVMDAMERKLGL